MIERHNPAGLHRPPGYHHITTVASGRLVFLAGQCPLDPAGELVGAGDLAAQTDQVIANIAIALAAAGAGPADVVRTVIYVVTSQQVELAAVWARLADSRISAAVGSASTLLGVAALGYPGQLVEVDVTAVVPAADG